MRIRWEIAASGTFLHRRLIDNLFRRQPMCLRGIRIDEATVGVRLGTRCAGSSRFADMILLPISFKQSVRCAVLSRMSYRIEVRIELSHLVGGERVPLWTFLLMIHRLDKTTPAICVGCSYIRIDVREFSGNAPCGAAGSGWG